MDNEDISGYMDVLIYLNAKCFYSLDLYTRGIFRQNPRSQRVVSN